VTEAPRGRLAALLKGTIWDRHLLDEEVPARFRSLYSLWLPIAYGLFVLYGAAGTFARVPSIVKVAGVGFGDVWTVLIGAFGIVALVGLVGRWALPEFLGALLVGTLMLLYVGSLIFLTFTGDLDRLALTVGVLVFIILPAWRCIDIARVERRRRHGR
jgi:hypothetical protein